MAVLATLLLPAATFAKSLNANFDVKINTKLIKLENHAEAKAEHQDKKDEQKEEKQEKKLNKATTVVGTIIGIPSTTSTLTINAKSGGTFTVNIANAELKRRFGAPMTAADFQVNDQVEVKGTVSSTLITATMIRDLSLQARNGEFSGTVVSVTTNSFVLQSANRGLQTINLTASTTIKKNGQPAILTDLTAGAKVKVAGVWNRTNENVTAKSVNIIVKVTQIHIVGTVTVKTDSNLTVMGENNTNYNVDASHSALYGWYYHKITLSQVNVGDKLNLWGKHEGTSTNINAFFIQDVSMTATSTVSVSL